MVNILEPNYFMSVIDIKSAYRAVPIKPSHRKYQGFSWFWEGENRWFLDNRLCFGLRLGPMYFNLISSFIYDVLSKRFNLNVVNYLDDFIAIAVNESECLTAQTSMIHLLRFLGFHVSYNKAIHPSKAATILGIVIDTEGLELRLPEGKVARLKNLLDQI